LASLTGRRNWPREGRQPVRDAGGPVPPGAGRVRPNSDSTSEPTPPIYIRGGATIPYIYIYIRGSFARTRKLEYFAPADIRGGKFDF